jgi:hypothetical protein
MNRLGYFRAAAAITLACALLLAGCTALPRADEVRTFRAQYPGGAVPAGADGRARFREIFCGLAARPGTAAAGELECGQLLWRLGDEPAPEPAPAPPPDLPSGLQVFVVSGAFGDCRLEDMFPYGDEIERLAAAGVPIRAVKVSGRSGSGANARQIAAAIRAAGTGDQRLVLLGYSKGAVDILQFLVDEPELAQHVAAVVSVAGPIFGSPLAEKADWWYRTFLERSFGSFCDPGDAGVIASLLPATRRQWLAEHPLPGHVRYFSIAAFPTREHLSRGLKPSWRILAGSDRFNDGQVLARDAVIPGSTLLGYLAADHWDVAISLDKQLPVLSARPSQRQFPRAELLQAMLAFVGESLAADSASPP